MSGSAFDFHTRFLELHLRHQRGLFSYLLAALRDYQQAEDLLQEITLILWKKFGQYQESMPYSAWAFGVARRELARHFRDTGRHKEALGLLVLDGVADSMIEEEERLSTESRALAACLEKLAPDQRELVASRYELGCSLQDLAEKLGQTVAAVNMKLVRLRRALLECTARALVKGV